jgi:phosphopantetheine--protein transferase-like protein
MLRVGIDLERIERFVFDRTPGRQAFYQQVYTPTERKLFGKDPVRLALCFTAKEAVSKVLGTGLGLGDASRVSCPDIEIHHEPGMSQPEVVLKRQAQAVANQLDVIRIVLDWYHNHHLACTIAAGGDPLEVVNLGPALQQALQQVILKSESGD